MKRIFKIVPGYDCRVECKHTPSGDHGIHGDEWLYAVVADDGISALSLTVFSDVYPSTVDMTFRRRPQGSDLSLHVGFATEPEDCRFDVLNWQACDVLGGGRCVVFKSSAWCADEFWKAHGRLEPEQLEAFWTALEAKFSEWDAEARAARVEAETWTRCNCCDGLGRVQKETS
jgi:hypothetical protein